MVRSVACQETMKTVISASRRTDLVAFFPGWLASSLKAKTASVHGPSGRVLEVDLAPEHVHTFVLWSKNFGNLLRNDAGLKDLLKAYDQIYCHFTITGLGGTPIEPGSPALETSLAQIPGLVALAGRAERVSIRFDPIVFWRDGDARGSNLPNFGRVAEAAAAAGVRDLRISFAQWYRKARRRASGRGFAFIDPAEEEKIVYAAELAGKARALGLTVYACSQPFLAPADGVVPSSCIDGRLLQALHPKNEPTSLKKDRTQRAGCLCTESKDIGSYTQACPHGCVYCYANPQVGDTSKG